MAGKDEPQADNRVNVWIEDNKTSCGVFGSLVVSHGSLRIMMQVDGDKPKCVGTIKPDIDYKYVDVLKFDFQPNIISRTYTHDNGDPFTEVYIKI